MELQHEKKYIDNFNCLHSYGSKFYNNVRNNHALSFAKMDQKQRKRTVRAILCAWSPHKYVTIKALNVYDKQQRKRRKKENAKNGVNFYLLHGQRMWQPDFCAVVQLTRANLNRMAIHVFNDGVMEKQTRLHQSHYGLMTIQKALCVTFLRRFRRRFGLACPTRWSFRYDEPVRYIDPGVSKDGV